MSEIARTGQARPDAVVFGTYLEAHQEASRRRAGDVASGLVSKVVRSYGGYVIRSWPVDLLAEPELRQAFDRERPVYAAHRSLLSAMWDEGVTPKA